MGESNRKASQDSAKKWASTRVQFLLKNTESGIFYARYRDGGMPVWVSLKTKQISIAEAKLKKLLSQRKDKGKAKGRAVDGKMTLGDAIAGHLEVVALKGRKEKTLIYWEDTRKFLLKTWPGVEKIEARKVSERDCQEWAAKAATATTSNNRYNNAIGLLKNVFDYAIDQGGTHTNPAATLERKRVTGKRLELPTRQQLAEINDILRSTPNERGGADLAQGLAYTGMRAGEARLLTWDRVDLSREEIHIIAERDGTGTKSGISRRVPLSGAALAFFRALKADSGGSGRVFVVDSCIKALQRACKEIGIKPLTHHDLRHYFATICIESGVDIPTVSRWLGHQDGGALAMRVYGHLREEHSKAAARKVEF